MQRFGKLYKEYCNGQIPKVRTVDNVSTKFDFFHRFSIKVEWLDRITFREIAIINDNERKKSEYIFLLIEFQDVEFGNHKVSSKNSFDE